MALYLAWIGIFLAPVAPPAPPKPVLKLGLLVAPENKRLADSFLEPLRQAMQENTRAYFHMQLEIQIVGDGTGPQLRQLDQRGAMAARQLIGEAHLDYLAYATRSGAHIVLELWNREGHPYNIYLPGKPHIEAKLPQIACASFLSMMERLDARFAASQRF